MALDKAFELAGLKTKQKKERRKALGFIFPALIAFVIFIFWPLMYTFYLSLFKWNMIKPTKEFVGLSNYIWVFTDTQVRQLALNTILYIVILIVFTFLVPYVLSFIMSFVIKRFSSVYKTLIFLPSLISLVVGAMIFLWIFNPISGPLAEILGYIGLTLPTWSKTKGLVIFVISLVVAYKSFGYNLLVLLSGVSAVPTELIEAARLERTPNRKIFTKIVVPLSSSTAIYVLIISIVQGMQFVFTPIQVLTQGGPDNASSNIIYGVYQQAFGFHSTGRASALSVVVMLLFLVLLILEYKFVEKGVYYEN